MSMKRFLVVGLALVMLLMSLAGCGGGDKSQQSTTPEQKQEEKKEADSDTAKKAELATLKAMLPGDRPTNMEEVIAEAEKRMADSVNVKLDVVFVSWADLSQKTQITLSSGENIDLIFDAPWLHMGQMISNNFYEPLESLLEKNGPNIIKTRPQEMWDANKFEGKIYGIPLGAFHYQGRGYILRKDIREKLGIPEIKTYEDLKTFMYAVKDKEKSMAALAGRVDSMGGVSPVFQRIQFDDETFMRTARIGGDNLTFYYENNDGKIYNLIDKMQPKFWESVQENRKLYLDGVMHQDALSVKSEVDLFVNGKLACMTANDFGVPKQVGDDLKKNIAGAEAEYVTFFNPSVKKISNFLQYNFICVAAVSKNKERAIQFLDWANEKDNYDLLAYGIKGKNWEPVGDDLYKPLENAYRWYPYAWIWSPTLERLDATQPEFVNKWNRWSQDSNNFEKDALTGFMFDPAPVADEVSKHNTLYEEYVKPLLYGVADPDSTWAKYKEKAAPYVKKIHEEADKQAAEFLKK